MTVFRSPHPDLALPSRTGTSRLTLPRLLLDLPLATAKRDADPQRPRPSSTVTSAPTAPPPGHPIFYPVDPDRADTAALLLRPTAQPLDLAAVDALATRVARAFVAADPSTRDSTAEAPATEPRRRRECVALFSFNQHDYVPLILGLHRAGLCVALCNPSYTPRELADQLRLVRATRVVAASAVRQRGGGGGGGGVSTTSSSSVAASTAAAADTPYHRALEAARMLASTDDDGGQAVAAAAAVRVWTWEEGSPADVWAWCDAESERAWREGRGELVERELARRRTSARASDDAVYCFSSGTSGKPKAVRLSHHALVCNTVQASVLLRDRMRSPLVRSYRDADERADGGAGGRGRGGGGAQVAKDWYDDVERELGPKRLARAEKEVHLDILPQFHCYGLLVQLVALHTATPRHVHPRFDLGAYLSTVAHRRVTFGFVVPPVIVALANQSKVDEYDVSSLTKLASGAATLAPSLVERLARRLRRQRRERRKGEARDGGDGDSGAVGEEDEEEDEEEEALRITDGYGMTEMSPIISMQNLRDVERAPGTVGALAPNTLARVLSPEGRALGADEPGELVLHGPQMMSGYLDNDEANRAAFITFDDDDDEDDEDGGEAGGLADGEPEASSSATRDIDVEPPTGYGSPPRRGRRRLWLRTGDVARVDARGYVSITDRLKDVVKSKGFQVSPAELEELLSRHQAVHEAAVVGVRRRVVARATPTPPPRLGNLDVRSEGSGSSARGKGNGAGRGTDGRHGESEPGEGKGVQGREEDDVEEVPWAFVVLAPSHVPPATPTPPSATATTMTTTTAERRPTSASASTTEAHEPMERQLARHVNSQVAGYKRLAGVEVVASLPKSAAGKVLKRELREAWQRRHDDGRGGGGTASRAQAPPTRPVRSEAGATPSRGGGTVAAVGSTQPKPEPLRQGVVAERTSATTTTTTSTPARASA